MNHVINRNGIGRDNEGNRLCDPICRLRQAHAKCSGPRAIPFDRVGSGTRGKRSKAAWKEAQSAGFDGPLRAYRRRFAVLPKRLSTQAHPNP